MSLNAFKKRLADLEEVRAVERLTEDQIFAICFAAGVPVEVGPNGILRTAHPCAVEIVDGKFMVFTNPNIK